MKWPAWLPKGASKKIIIIIAVAVVASSGLAWHLWHNAQTQNANHNALAQDEIRLYKNDKTTQGMQVLAGAYEQNGQYNQAKTEWQKIAGKTNHTLDWQALLTICTSYPVAGRQDCINKTAKILISRAKAMDFDTAYSLGLQLEDSGYSQLARPFYKRALAIYNPPKVLDSNYLTKAQLQEKTK